MEMTTDPCVRLQRTLGPTHLISHFQLRLRVAQQLEHTDRQQLLSWKSSGRNEGGLKIKVEMTKDKTTPKWTRGL